MIEDCNLGVHFYPILSYFSTSSVILSQIKLRTLQQSVNLEKLMVLRKVDSP